VIFDAKTKVLLSFASPVTIFGFGLNYAGFATGSKLLQDYAQYISIVRRMASSLRQKISPVDVSLRITVSSTRRFALGNVGENYAHLGTLTSFWPSNSQKYLRPNIPFLRFPILTNCSIHPSGPVQSKPLLLTPVKRDPGDRTVSLWGWAVSEINEPLKYAYTDWQMSMLKFTLLLSCID
jgi:hypothetical protein